MKKIWFVTKLLNYFIFFCFLPLCIVHLVKNNFFHYGLKYLLVKNEKKNKKLWNKKLFGKHFLLVYKIVRCRNKMLVTDSRGWGINRILFHSHYMFIKLMVETFVAKSFIILIGDLKCAFKCFFFISDYI